MDSTEHGLLEAFKHDQSEDAFRDLVARHLNMVYHTALRATGNATIAEDVSQQVFTILARKASRLKAGSGVGGWLHRVTAYESAKAMRAENRRALKMKEYAERQSLCSTECQLLENILPWLDDAIDSLSESDRRVIILRFFDGHHFRDIAAALGKSEDAAQKQVSRAVGKIARRLERHGFRAGTASLGSMLIVEGSKAAPQELLGSIAHHSLTEVSSLTATTNFLHTLTTMSKLKTIFGTGLAVLAVVLFGLYFVGNPTIDDNAGTLSPVSSIPQFGSSPLIEPIIPLPAEVPPGWVNVDLANEVAKAEGGARALRNVVRQFHLNYPNYLIFSKSPTLVEDFSVSSDAAIMAIFLGLDRERNPRRIQFGDWASGNSNGIVTDAGSSFDGSFVDSWGLPYMISIDGDGDGHIQDPADPENMLDNVIMVYSAGPDGDFRSWDDNVSSSR